MGTIIAHNYDLKDTCERTFRFKQPLKVRSARRSYHLQSVTARLRFTRRWYSETVKLDAENAFKDWISGQLVLSPGDNSLHIVDTNITGDKSKRTLEENPPCSAKSGLVFNQGNLSVAMTLIEGMHSKSEKEIPDIRKHIVVEDLNFRI